MRCSVHCPKDSKSVGLLVVIAAAIAVGWAVNHIWFVVAAAGVLMVCGVLSVAAAFGIAWLMERGEWNASRSVSSWPR